jgi:uncharacterized protein (TIGR00730 family)
MTGQSPTKAYITIFCGSSHQVSKTYLSAAAEVGRMLCCLGFGVVYGGGGRGMMGALADAVLAEGGEIRGVIPRFMIEREWAHPGVSAMDVVSSMAERKQRLLDLGNLIMALPGGIGTLDEFFEALTLRQLGCHDKPLLLFNPNGYYDPLLRLSQHMQDQGFWGSFPEGRWHDLADLADLKAFLLGWQKTGVGGGGV